MSKDAVGLPSLTDSVACKVLDTVGVGGGGIVSVAVGVSGGVIVGV